MQTAGHLHEGDKTPSPADKESGQRRAVPAGAVRRRGGTGKGAAASLSHVSCWIMGSANQPGSTEQLPEVK